MYVTIIKTGSTSLNVRVIYRRLTELMITPVRKRRDTFINTVGFHHKWRCVFHDTKEIVEILFPLQRCFITLFSLAANRPCRRFKISNIVFSARL